MILTIRTDKPESEIGLYDGQNRVAYKIWEAHRQLAETIHSKIGELLGQNNQTLQDLTGIVIYQGPGSFTGLRIGMSVANALAYSYDLPITATSGENWQTDGVSSIQIKPEKKPVMPEYGSAPHITRQKK